VVTVAATVAYELARPRSKVEPTFAASFLWLLSALFLVRAVGQVVARERRPTWLPPSDEWNLLPYRLLLPIQMAILAFMAWIGLDLSFNAGFWAGPRSTLGDAMRWFAYAYAGAMALRYLVRMRRRPDQRWSGGAIPIVFHWVLAAYVYVLGTFHASY
jgi:hypothetical protein